MAFEMYLDNCFMTWILNKEKLYNLRNNKRKGKKCILFNFLSEKL